RGGSVIYTVLTEEVGNVRNLINDSGSRPDHSFSIPRRIPDHSHAGREVVVIAIIRRAHLRPDLFEPHLWIEIPQQVVLFLDHRAQVVAHSRIYREVGSHA